VIRLVRGDSATPALSVLRWRYRDQLEWRLVTIGLREDTASMAGAAYTPARQAASARRFRDRYGMPFAAMPAPRPVATGRACCAIVATRIAHPGREFAVLRALAFARFNTGLLLDEDDAIATALAGVDGIDAASVAAALDSAAVSDAYEADKAEARTAKGAALGGSSDRLVVDLHLLHHPSCRYAPEWQCPLAPSGNAMVVEVKAGERM
jgi:2-hydroxychromene-2-carboxylate isomerase